MVWHSRHGRASLTALSVITLLGVSGVAGFAFGKFIFGERILKQSASEVRVPDAVATLEPKNPEPPADTRTYIRSVSEYSLTPDPDYFEPFDERTPAPAPGGEGSDPAAPAAPGAAAPAPAGKVTFVVMIGSFLDESNAVIWRDDLNNRGYNAVIQKSEETGQIFYRVVVGRFTDRVAADRAAEKLRREGYQIVVITEQAEPEGQGADAGTRGRA